MPFNNVDPSELHQQSDAEMHDEEPIASATVEAVAPMSDSTLPQIDLESVNGDEAPQPADSNADTDTDMNEGDEEAGDPIVANAAPEIEQDEANAVAGVVADADPFYGFEDEEPNFDSKDMAQVLQVWEAQHTRSGFDPVPVLKRLAEIFEKEKEIYMRKDPDPFEERHPYRTDPKCQFGVLLKQLFRKDNFMNKLVNDYLRDNFFTRQNIQKSSLELNILACRLILVIMPGLETSAVFQGEFEHLIHRIYGWAEDSIEPLQSYATGLLGAAMEVTEIAVSFKELNTRLIPKMLKRLHMLQAIYKSCRESVQPMPSQSPMESSAVYKYSDHLLPSWITNDTASQSPPQLDEQAKTSAADELAHHNSVNAADMHCSNSNISALPENSRDAFPRGSGSRYYKKMYIPLHPPTAETSQMLILRYLTALGDHQEYLGLVFEHNAMQLIFGYLENLDRRDTCLAFEALKYLASMLYHKKFALEFISHGGLELLLKVPRPSIAATGVSITMYYLAYCEDAMERICNMPRPMIRELVHYVLWLMERSYDSGTCHATMFFGLSFQFKIILDEFDSQDGLRKLCNVISILKILNPSNNDDDQSPVNDDLECASRQLVRHVCVALKRYMESHLFYKYNNFMRQQCPISSEFSQNIVTKAAKANLEQISDQVRTLQENTSVRAHWAPVDKLLKISGISLLLKIIALCYDWNNNVRSEIVRSALDVLSICCVIPRVFLVYCERLDMPNDVVGASGIYFILAAASGDIIADVDVQKSALAVLVHCVCAPLARKEPNNLMKVFSSSKRNKHNNRYCEELIEKVWESVCSNNGIIILLSLMQIKAPITDADCIRGMACRALAGLARSERVRQIVGKLRLFASGQIQTLMRDPILQEKRTEHVLFQKYALELLERVSGKTKPISNKMDPSLSNIHKANVIAQTKIQYNEQQLYQLIHDHLESKGLVQTAHTLQKEAGLPSSSSNTTKNFHQSPFDYKVVPSSSVRQRLRSRMQDVNTAINNIANATSTEQQLNTSFTAEDLPTNNVAVTPIKLVKKTDKPASAANANISANAISMTNAQRSLQKQISSLPEDVRPENGSPTMQHSNQTGITLGTIVTEYLTNQHALCNNPMTTCPQFDLFTPHKCPDPKPNRAHGGDNLNLTARIFKAQAGYNTSRVDRRYVHSNFAPWRSVRSNDFPDLQFSSCEIVSASKLLLVGTHRGEAKAFNLSNGLEVFSSLCHSYVIDSIISNRAGDLVLTSCSWRSPLSVLWSIQHNEFTSKLSFADDYYCEFSNLTQDKVLGTQNDCAIIYDINTGNKISTFTPTLANQYTKNHATFCPTDELILSDGVLWDVRSGKEIHKFDKLNQVLSGVFHPNGLEIVSNTEVWDLRTFHLLQTVPALQQCLLKFSPMRVIYSYSADAADDTVDQLDELPSSETSFKVLDAYDYSSISTIDVRRGIFDMSINDNGSLIALVENQPSYDSKAETFVKIYAVGMKKVENQEEVRHSDASFIGVSASNGSSNIGDRAATIADADDVGDGDDNPIDSNDDGGSGGDRDNDGNGQNQDVGAGADNNRDDGDHIRRFGHIREINIDIDASPRHGGSGGVGGTEEIIVSFRSSALPAAASGNGGVGVVIGGGGNGHAAPRPSAAGGSRLAPAAGAVASRGGARNALRANRNNRGVTSRVVGSGVASNNGNVVGANNGAGAGAAQDLHLNAIELIDAIASNLLSLLSGR